MADISSHNAPAAQAPAPEVVPTPPAAQSAAPPLPLGAEPVDIDAFAASLESGAAAAPENPSGSEVKKPTPTPEGKTTETDPNAAPEAVEGGIPAEAPSEEDAEEAQALEQSRDEKVPKWVPDRLAKNAEQKRLLREENAALKTRAETAEAAVASAAAEPKVPASSSPLAHFDSPEALEAESSKVIQFLQDAQAPGFMERYQDSATETAEQQFDRDRGYALGFLKLKDAHAKVLTDRSTQREALRKAAPALFDGKSPASLERAALYKADPRSRADFDQWIADAQRGKAAREADAKVKATAVAAAAKPGTTAAHGKANGSANPPKFTPPGPSGRVPVRSNEQPDARQVIKAKAASGGVTADEMIDAGVL